MCGENPECFKELQNVKTVNVGVDGCTTTSCSHPGILDGTCTTQRGPEVCEKITKYYNPLYLGGKVVNGSPVDFSCDDNKGKHIGTYQCLGEEKKILSNY